MARFRSLKHQQKRGLPKYSTRACDELDQRTVEAKEERQIIAELTRHVGGTPTATQKILIKRVARACVIVSIIERRVLETGELGDLQARQMMALWNSTRLGLDKLGLEPPEQGKHPELSEFLATRTRPRVVA